MTMKNRIAKLEKRTVVHEPPKENPNITAEMWERSLNALAGALGGIRAEVETALQELTHEQP